MPRLNALKSREVLGALEHLGFQQVRQKGSHVRLQKGNVSITVPIHARDIPPGTVRGIIAQAGLTIEEFLEALDA